jgi:hypothetical protein
MYPILVRIVDAVTSTFAETVLTRKPVTTRFCSSGKYNVSFGRLLLREYALFVDTPATSEGRKRMDVWIGERC